jgi:Arsenical resistance operon protein ArsD
MRSITVVERPICGSSGVCGPEPDPTLVRFAGEPCCCSGLADRFRTPKPTEQALAPPAGGGCC